MKASKLSHLALAWLAGYACALLFLWVNIANFRPDFNMGNLIQAGATVAAAIVVAALIQKKTQANFKQKELIVGQLERAGERLSQLGLVDFTEGKDYPAVVSDLKLIGTIFAVVNVAVKELRFGGKVCKQVNFTKEIVKLRKLATDTEEPLKVLAANAKACSAVVQQNILKLDQQRCAAIATHITNMRTKVFSAQMAILAA